MTVSAVPTIATSQTPSRLHIPATGWRGALVWGISIAIVHRIVLMLWLPLAWSILGAGLNGGNPDFHTSGAPIPAFDSPAGQQVFGVWRRWDAIHYLNLSVNGYRVDNPGPTVFGPLTPLLISTAYRVVPSVDAAAAVVETIAFAIALAFLFRIVETYYADAALARWSVVIMALLPLSFFFAAPLSESPYMASALAVFYCAARGKWLAAGIAGVLAVMGRSQGVLLVLPAAVLLLQQNWQRQRPVTVNLTSIVRRGWPLILLPLAYAGFEWSRLQAGLPPASTVYAEISFIYLTNPLDGLLTNLRWMVTRPQEAVPILDSWALVCTLILALASLCFRTHRRLALQVFTWAFLLLYLSKMNWYYGTNIPYYTQSFGRYALTLFPLTVLIADGVRRCHPIVRMLLIAGFVLALLLCSALFTLALAGP